MKLNEILKSNVFEKVFQAGDFVQYVGSDSSWLDLDPNKKYEVLSYSKDSGALGRGQLWWLWLDLGEGNITLGFGFDAIIHRFRKVEQ